MSGWFGGSPSLPKPKTSVDGAPIAPDRTQRAKCWEGRDAYFACLEKHDIIDSIAEAAKAETFCGTEGRNFEGVCASSWVIYFKKRRVFEHKKALTIEQLKKEDAQKLPGNFGPGGAPK